LAELRENTFHLEEAIREYREIDSQLLFPRMWGKEIRERG